LRESIRRFTAAPTRLYSCMVVVPALLITPSFISRHALRGSMIPETFTCDAVTWERAVALSRTLAAEVRASGYRPDLVVAIGRGGYVPARIVCDELLIMDLDGIRVEHWGTVEQKSERAVIRRPLVGDIADLSVLIVDDVTDTGDTFAVAVDHLETFGPRAVRTGALIHKEVSDFVPDYYAEHAAAWQWVIFPWARHEDLVGFSEKIVSGGPADAGEIRAILTGRYGIKTGEEEVLEALDDLVASGRVVRRGPLYLAAGG
jgi:hypoxanthine phosphoribosyltransferase